MAKKSTDNQYLYKYKSDYQSDWDLHQNFIQQSFDEYEAMLLGLVYDSVSGSVDGSKITDSYAATLAMERSARSMGKLPDGGTEATGKADQGKAAMMDMLRMKWMYPNMNSQHPLKVKLQMWDLYSEVYGYMPMFYDWNVSHTGYIGPDCWLWNPRNLVPQQGKISVNDMDYVTALTWINKKALENIIDNAEEGDGWDRDAIQRLIELSEQESTDNDKDKDTLVDRERTPGGKKKGICIATRYEAGPDGKWISFAPDHSCVEIRNTPNPHKNGRIPFVVKYSQTLYDSFYGLGGFQRAKPLQFARDGLTNFYFKGIKMNLIPPIIANANGVVKHTLDYREGAVMLETIPNSIRRLDTSNAGLSTYQAAMSSLTGSLLAQSGSQNASIPGADALNPSQGKTPAAIGLYEGKEATRDGQNQDMLETAIEQLTDGLFSLVVNIGTEEVPIALFSKDIEAIVDAGMDDVLGIFVDEDGIPLTTKEFKPNETLTGGQYSIDPARLKGVEYRFNIESGSTKKLSKQAQLQELNTYIDTLGKFQNQFKDDPRIDINWLQINKVYASLLTIPGADKFVTVDPDAPNPQEQQAEMEQQSKLQDQEGQMQMQQQQQEGQLQQEQMKAEMQGEEETPAFVDGQMYKDPLVTEAAKHLTSL